ncbi:MAG TPA: glycerol kinase GlpK [Opitutaceae bacterium]|nr:glycerol kinase GlpK [Opitutaceae bacterium]
MPLLLAIDQSTSATKVLLFDENGRALDQVSRDHRQFYPEPGWVEHDAEEIWQNTLAAARELMDRHSARRAEIAGVSISNQRETIVVFDRTSGAPLHPAIVWQCRRGDPLCAAQLSAGREAGIRTRTGLRVDSYFSASKLQWLIRERPEIARRLADGTARVGTIDAYLIHRLTGGSVFATDHTNACRTLLFDIDRLDWDDELCAWWNVPRSALPQVRPSGARFGATTLGGALPAPVPICGVMGDSQAALFAQGCFEAGTAKATFGTGTSLLLNVGARRPAAAGGSVCTIGWVLDDQPAYVLEGIITFSAATLTWLRDQLGLINDPAETEALARAVPDNGGVYLVPAFSGLGAPHWRESARGAIVGLTAHSDRRHIVRAGLESIAFQVSDVVDMMRVEGGLALRRLQADGGATANRFLMQLVADLTGVELRVAGSPHYSPLGAAMMGMLGLGLQPSLAALAALPRDGQTYQPKLERAEVGQLRAGWRRAVRQVMTE